MRDHFYVYIMACNTRRTIYIGVTNSLLARIQQHRRQEGHGFAARYHTIHLVYYEVFREARDAIARETQLKKWRREKKNWLIEKMNPGWHDLATEIIEELPKIDKALAPDEMLWPAAKPHPKPCHFDRSGGENAGGA